MATTIRRASAAGRSRAGTGTRAVVPPAIVIRPATPGDADALDRLQRQADEIHARLMPDFFQVPSAERTSAPTPGPGSVVIVAVVPAGVVGCVAVKVVDRPVNPTVTQRRRAYVDSIVVDEPQRRRGIGTALMRAAVDWARQQRVAEIVLTVWSHNSAAEALYRHLGYEPIARVLRRAV